MDNEEELDAYPGYRCMACGEMFGKTSSFERHWQPIDPNEPMFADVRWSSEAARAFEDRWPDDNRRCGTEAEIGSLGMKRDHRGVWITPEEEAAIKRLHGELTP